MSPAALAVSIVVGVVGVILIVLGFAGRDTTAGLPASRTTTRTSITLTRAQKIQLIGGAVAGLIIALITGWWVLVVVVPVAAFGMPWLLAKGPEEHVIAKLDALESWTRSLAGLTVAGAGLERTISASLESCPDAIRPEVTQLVARLNARWTTSAALQAFADDLNDETADVLVMHLLRKAELRGAGLADALQDLAKSIFERVKMRRQIEADRAQPRSETRTIVYFTIALLVVLVLAHDYAAAYGTPVGQLLLTIYLAIYTVLLLAMRRISRGKTAPRLLVVSDKGGVK
ncbi:type II secretion system F family protein [Micromonospora sp. DT81.3]|uniref:type II secretion system F family protein n=1 Tax=Micromonospora sp. DT81.3 TaxID=3416523 RepID=UPI003CEED3C3